MPDESEMSQETLRRAKRDNYFLIKAPERVQKDAVILRRDFKQVAATRVTPLFLFCLCVTIHFASCIPEATAIDCFKCVSINGNNSACEDPFHNNYSSTILQRPCMAGRKHRQGLFPATACIKLAGVYNNERVMVRACALDSGSLTTDTEIIRVSHCGGFYFQHKYFRGCLQSCDDVDGCNGATGRLKKSWLNHFVLPMSLFSLVLTKSLFNSFSQV